MSFFFRGRGKNIKERIFFYIFTDKFLIQKYMLEREAVLKYLLQKLVLWQWFANYMIWNSLDRLFLLLEVKSILLETQNPFLWF